MQAHAYIEKTIKIRDKLKKIAIKILNQKKIDKKENLKKKSLN